MSTIVAQTLSNGVVSTSTANCIQGSAKAWVNFNGSGGAIRASYNVSSITVNGTGDYTVNFTNAFADANYAVSGLGGTPAVAAGYITYSATSPTTSAVRLGAVNSAGSLFNSSFVSVAIFR